MTDIPRIFRRRAPRLLACLVLFALTACGNGQDFAAPVAFEEPETLVDYEVVLEGAPTEEVKALIEESLLLYRRQEDGAQSLPFLRRRAQGDVPTVIKILRSYGYYQPLVETEVRAKSQDAPEDAAAEEGASPEAQAAPAEAEPTTEVEAQEAEPTEAVAIVRIEPGPAFTLARQDFVLSGAGDGPQPALGPAEAYGAPIGRPAVAQKILNAEGDALDAIKAQGFPYAEGRGRDAVADLEADTIEIDSRLFTGRQHRFGPVTVKGAPNVRDDYILTYLPFAEGDLADPAKLSEFQRELLATGLFRAGFVTLPPEEPEDATVPVTVELEEAPFRTFTAGARFDSDDGPGVRLGFEHRNLFGANEQLNLVLDATVDEQRLTATGLKPQFLRDGQALIATAEARRIEDDAFDELGTTLSLVLSREVTERWTLSGGGLVEFSAITDEGEDTTAYLLGLPFRADYDGSDSKLNPTRGERLTVDLTPFGGIFDSEFSGFLVADLRTSLYRRLSADGRYVAAVRGRFGAIPSAELDDIPATRRLYSGGAGSVRGFRQDFVGPLDEDEDPIGGRSVIEAGAELRYPIWDDVGGVVFVEGGTVSTEVFPNFEEDFLFAGGAGVRYYSPVGPIRFDIAFPINGRDADDTFQFYISIGQAF
ncbi:MAG: BamA/TamA family outer membrane protein [Pseudomonadota bacterium]